MLLTVIINEFSQILVPPSDVRIYREKQPMVAGKLFFLNEQFDR